MKQADHKIQALWDRARAVREPAGLPELQRILGEVTVAAMRGATGLTLLQENLTRRIARLESPPKNPVEIPTIPKEALQLPAPPAGLPMGWYREIRTEQGPVHVFARLLPDEEARELHWRLFGRPGEAGYDAWHDMWCTVFELSVANAGTKPVVYDPSKAEMEFFLNRHNNLRYHLGPSNDTYLGQAEKRLGAWDDLTKRLRAERAEIPPGGQTGHYAVFPRVGSLSNLDPVEINRVYFGRTRLLPTQPYLIPPGVRVPSQVVLQVTTRKIDGGRIFNSSERKYEYGVEVNNVEISGPPSPWGRGSSIEFVSDEPVFIPFSTGVAYVTATANEVGPGTLIAAETLRSRGASPYTNITPAWDPRGGPPEELEAKPAPRLLWQLQIGNEYNHVSASGRHFIIEAHYAPWEIVDAEGDTVQRFDSRGPKNLLLAPDGATVYGLFHDQLEARTLGGERIYAKEVEGDPRSLALLPGKGLLIGHQRPELNAIELRGFDGSRTAMFDEVDHHLRLAVAPDGKHVAAADGRYSLCLLDENLAVVGKSGAQIPSDIRGFHFSPDSTRVIHDFGGVQVVCRSASEGFAELWMFEAGDTVTGCAWLGSGRGIAVTTRTGHLILLGPDGTKRHRWRVEGNGIEGLAALAGRDEIAFTTQDGKYHCLDMAPVLDAP